VEVAESAKVAMRNAAANEALSRSPSPIEDHRLPAPARECMKIPHASRMR